jgi:hypothetical protein
MKQLITYYIDILLLIFRHPKINLVNKIPNRIGAHRVHTLIPGSKDLSAPILLVNYEEDLTDT